MNWQRSFKLWIAITLIWFSGFGIAAYLSTPDKDWIYWIGPSQALKKTTPSNWKANTPTGFGDDIIETRHGLKIAVPLNYAQRYRKVSYLQRVKNSIWGQHRAKQLRENWIIIILPFALLTFGGIFLWAFAGSKR